MFLRISSKRAGLALSAIVGGAFLMVAALSPGCKGVVVETIQTIPAPILGQTGSPCDPGDGKQANFGGYGVGAASLAGLVAACNSGICLVNHVQGRAACPLGQAAPTLCAGPGDTSCASGMSCAAAGPSGPYCYLESVDGGASVFNASTCESGLCNSPRHTCQCTSDAQCPEGTACDPLTQECTQYVCHHVGECQSPGATDGESQMSNANRFGGCPRWDGQAAHIRTQNGDVGVGVTSYEGGTDGFAIGQANLDVFVTFNHD